MSRLLSQRAALLLAGALSLAACSSAREPGPEPGGVGELVRFEPLLTTGASCHGTEESEAALRDAPSWRSWWSEVRCGASDAPALDFQREMVLAVRDRPGPTGCYRLRIAEVRTGVGGGYQVVVNRHVPERSTPCPMVIVHPAAAVKLPAVRGPVVFEWRRVEGPPPEEPAR